VKVASPDNVVCVAVLVAVGAGWGNRSRSCWWAVVRRNWRARARRASKSSADPDPLGWVELADPEVTCSEPDHRPPGPMSAAAASPPLPTRKARRPGDRASAVEGGWLPGLG
jgi:hypothetical protein